MIEKESESLLSKFLLLGPAAVTLFVVTSGVTDPVNVNKLLALGVFSCAGFALLTVKTYRFIWKEHKLAVIAGLGFVLASINSLLQSDSPITQQLYGVYGRNNGILLYLFLLLLFTAALTLTKISSVRMVLISLVVAGLVNLVYCGWVLLYGDFIGWSNPYGNILGTFGNPNFIGAFLGMFSSLLISLVIAYHRDIKILVPVILALGVTIIEIIESNAMQGRVLLVLGIVINGFYLVRSRFKSWAPLAIYSAMSAAGGIVGLLGTLQIGPLTQILYKQSVSLRGEYWNAGLNMGKTHLLSGVGFDSYGDWYRESRRASALITPGPETITNTSHNVFIDIFAFGGLPLIFFYLAIFGFVVLSIVRQTRRNQEFDPIFVSLSGAWLGYQLQSVISINQIGLALWGWLLGGSIIAYERISRNSSNPEQLKSKTESRKSVNSQFISPSLRAGIAMGLGLIIVVPPFSADVKWRSAQESRDVARIESILVPSYFNPPTSYKYLQIVGALEQSNLTDFAHKYAAKAVEYNPRSYESWRLFTLIRSATPEEIEIALGKMAELDPKNPNVAPSIK
jgi:hypothetical protein